VLHPACEFAVFTHILWGLLSTIIEGLVLEMTKSCTTRSFIVLGKAIRWSIQIFALADEVVVCTHESFTEPLFVALGSPGG
jgi:hypothetical protein